MKKFTSKIDAGAPNELISAIDRIQTFEHAITEAYKTLKSIESKLKRGDVSAVNALNLTLLGLDGYFSKSAKAAKEAAKLASNWSGYNQNGGRDYGND